MNFLYTLIRRALKTVEDKVDICAAQPALEGGLPLEFSAVTPQMVGPDVKALDRFILLKVMNIYKTNLIRRMVRISCNYLCAAMRGVPRTKVERLYKSPRPMHRLTAAGVILTESPLLCIGLTYWRRARESNPVDFHITLVFKTSS